MRDVNRVLWYWGPVALYTGLIFVLSAQSHPDEQLPPFLLAFSDKLLHAGEYAVLGGLFYRAFRWGTTGRWARHAVGFAVVAASLYGVSDELHQWMVPLRESSWQDWVADTVGAAVGALAMQRLHHLLPRLSAPALHERP